MEVDCVKVVSGSSSGDFVVVAVLEDFEVALWSSWRMTLWGWNERGDFLRRFRLMSVAGNMLVAIGAYLFGIVIQWGFLNFFDFFDFLGLMEEVWVLCGGGGLRCRIEWIVGGCALDVSEDPDLIDGGHDGLDSGGARWWVRYRFPRVCAKLWEGFPNILPFFFNFYCDVLFFQPGKEKW